VKLGFDPVWFGIIVVMMVEIGVLTPPLGTNVYVVKAAADAIGYPVALETIFAALWPFFVAYLVAVAIIVAFPSIALFLVNIMWQ
jgi:TRAP-type C4-dicarboxylate transport system permease large subunit